MGLMKSKMDEPFPSTTGLQEAIRVLDCARMSAELDRRPAKKKILYDAQVYLAGQLISRISPISIVSIVANPSGHHRVYFY